MSSRLPELSQDAFSALAKAALLEDPFLIQAIIRSGCPPESLDPLFDHGLLEEADPGEAAIKDESTRNAALEVLPWSQKRRFSGQLAQATLELNLDPALIGKLYLGAHRHTEARRQFVRGAELACRRHAHREALDLMRSALDLWPLNEEPEERRRLLYEMARCAGICSEHATARLVLQELADTTTEATPVAERIELWRKLAQAAKLNGDRRHAREVLETAAQFAQENALTGEGGWLWRMLAQEQGDDLRLRDALNSVAKAIEAARVQEDWALLSDGLAYSAMLTAMIGQIREARKRLEEALAIALRHDLTDQITTAYRRQANVNEYASAYEAYRDTELRALEHCRALGQTSGTQACLSCVSYAFFRLGQFDESLAAIAEAIDEFRVEGELYAGAVSVRACVRAARGTGSDAEILGELRGALQQTKLHNARVFEFYLHWMGGCWATLEGRSAEARTFFHDLIEFWRETDDRKDVTPGLMFAATFHAEQNDHAHLGECLDILNLLQTESESGEPRCAFLAASAEDAWLRGKPDEAIPRLEEALKGYRELKLGIEEVWTLWRLGHMQSQHGSAEEATATWKAAEPLIAAMDLKPFRRAILRSRKQAPESVSHRPGLTPRQLEIARLIAAGQTSKEAADTLGLSPRTVEMHVASFVARMGARTRPEAVSRALELGLLET